MSETLVKNTHRTLLGGNLDVVSALKLHSIGFSANTNDPLNDGSLINSTAYIQYWSRGGTKEVLNAEIDDYASAQANDSQSVLVSNIKDLYGTTDTLPSSFSTQIVPQIPETRQSLSTITPTIGQGSSQFTNPIQNTSLVNSEFGGKSLYDVSTENAELLKPGNPSGVVKYTYKGKAEPFPVNNGKGSAGRSPQASLPKQKGMWQFLFNPSEIELEAGPEFISSEVWGVSDKANSGQPLHWSHNKNAKLVFNSVILNGYVFGRKVEELEQGILELFMARESEGQSGPPVLEFVWGNKIFGPCVIRDISIKEKMWDEGEVVNAELSFTLEQIPEWTINDGFVDIARPSKVPSADFITDLVGQAGTTPSPAELPPADGSGAKPDPASGQKPASGPLAFTTCKAIQSDRDAALKLATSIENAPADLYYGTLTSTVTAYTNLYDKYSKSSFYSADINKNVAAKCKTPGKFQAEYNNYKNGTLVAGGRSVPTDAELIKKSRELRLGMAGCASGIATAMGNVFESRCKQFRANPNNRSERI